ncbi:TonB-dependent receptor [Marinimicrobium alkaliphilum]|uniref:TonB-dependent receptor n=1 Tax=Marinimicrobium alkaliphilum TaxID=2202654 RepID=UPI000DB9D85D|nr:TonB-dependent receptor [Marinimicrobium alkaliphilum]
MKHFTIKPLVLAMAVSAVPAVAQAQDSDILEEVIVTGSFRDSLANALNQKRTAVGSQDSIMSEDIGKLPDMNLADSLQRVPGVAITREAGEGRQVSLRGLGPEFNRVTINGMESASATDGLGGSNRNTGRAFDFNVFASELFNRIDVHKTQESRNERGLAGGIDLHTSKPFDFDGFNTFFSAQGLYNDLNEELTPRVAVMASNTFADDTMGLLVSLAYSERDVRVDGHTTVRWQENDALNGGDGFFPRIPRASTRSTSQERLGITTSFQFRPNDDFELTADLLVAKLDSARDSYEFQAAMQTATGSIQPQHLVLDTNTGGEPEIVAASLENVRVMSEAVREEAKNDFYQLTVKSDWALSDNWTMSALVGTGQSDFSKPVENTMGMATDGRFAYSYVNGLDPRDTAQTSATRNMDIPHLWFDANPADASSWDTTNSDHYGMSLFRLRSAEIENKNNTAKVDFNYSLDYTSSLSFGLAYRKFEMNTVDARSSGAQESYFNGPDGSVDGLTQNMPFTNFGSGLGAPAEFPRSSSWLSPDYNAFMAEFGGGQAPVLNDAGTAVIYDPANPLVDGARSFGVTEEITSGYIQIDWESEFLGRTLRGNSGLRIAHTETTSSVFNTLVFAEDAGAYDDTVIDALTNATALPTGERPNPLNYFVNQEGSYTDVLPSLNLALDITDDLVGRFSFSRALTRAPLSNLSTAVNISVFNGTVATGNPSLEPYRADQVDLGLEWYFANDAVLGGTVFWKDLTTDISRESTSRPLTAQEITNYNLQAFIDDGRFAPEDEFVFNTPTNSRGDDLLGAELVYQQPFTNLPGILSNTGIAANYTFIDAKQEYTFGGQTISAGRTGISKHSFNVVTYYEVDDWGTRLSYNWRDEYLLATGNRNGLDSEGRKAAAYLDMSAFYHVNDSLTVSFEALNMLDTFESDWVGVDNNLPVNYMHSGRQFMVGIRGSF